MLNETTETTKIQLCSRCLMYEVDSWVNEKWAELDENAKKQIREELKAISLASGKCIVCNNSLVSDGTIENILAILERNNVQEKTKIEFRKLFGFII